MRRNAKRLGVVPIGLLVVLIGAAGHHALSAQTSSVPYTWNNAVINGGGFVTGIVFHPKEANLVYARTDIGGLYRWNQTAGRWIPLLDWIGPEQWGYTGVWSVALDPNNADAVYAAVGTYTNGWDPNNGAVLKSTDRGATWSISPLPFKGHGNMPGRGSGERLTVDPNNGSILYLGATGSQTQIYGLWRSTDGGARWSEVTSFPKATGDWKEDPNDYWNYANTYQGILWVEFDPRTVSGGVTQTIYVGVATKNHPTVYRSTDGGVSWAAVPGQPVNFPDNDPDDDMHLMPKKGMFHAGSGVLYVTYGHRVGPYEDGKGDVYKYDTRTATWTVISPVPNNGVLFEGDNYYGYSGIAIDGQNPNILMVTGYSSWWPDTYIWRSTDGGATWRNIWRWTRYPAYERECNQDISGAPWLDDWEGGSRPPVVNPKLGWMTEALAIDPFNSDRFMYGTGAIIFGTDDATKWDDNDTSTKFTLRVYSIGLEETSIARLTSPPTGGQLVAGIYDIAGARWDNLTAVADNIFDAGGGAHDIDFAELSPGKFFRVGKHGHVEDGDNPPHAALSTDGARTWTTLANPSGVTGYGGGGFAAINADGTMLIWAPEDDPTIDDDPTTWQPIPVQNSTSGKRWAASTGIPSWSVVRADRVNPNKIYGFKAGTFYRSVDGGKTFAATGAGGLPTTTHADVHAVAGIEGDIWLAGGSGTNYGLWHSTDSGTSFTKLTNVDEADNIGFGKAAAGSSYVTLYTSAKIGGVRGIFRSTDAGATWVRINDDLHQWAWTGRTITGDPRIFGRVYVGTNGRGIIYGNPQ